MKNFLQKNRLKVCIVILAVFAFGWFELRPTAIRANCSWVKRYTLPVAEVTQAQTNQANIDLATCQKEYPNHKTVYDELIPNNGGYQGLPSPECAALVLAAQGPHPAVPSRTYYVAADSAQYSFCLHSHGL